MMVLNNMMILFEFDEMRCQIHLRQAATMIIVKSNNKAVLRTIRTACVYVVSISLRDHK